MNEKSQLYFQLPLFLEMKKYEWKKFFLKDGNKVRRLDFYVWFLIFITSEC